MQVFMPLFFNIFNSRNLNSKTLAGKKGLLSIEKQINNTNDKRRLLEAD